MLIKIAARNSNLSKEQVKEFQSFFLRHYPHTLFESFFLATYGDKDHSISLRQEQYDDLFTKEIDEMVLEKKADIAIHSAKDLPKVIHPDLEIYWMSRSIHPQDALVMKEGYSLQNIPQNGIVLASSLRREEAVHALRADLIVKDVRGTIEERLKFLNDPNIYGVVIAEAALIRLKLTHLNRMIIDFPAHPMQGKLAVVGRKKNQVVERIFQEIEEKDFTSGN